ncbi:MAG: signal peptidase I [Oscillospiraceae bacterium]|nr:signal peptidase I [Oscillospiraceae bacterium]
MDENKNINENINNPEEDAKAENTTAEQEGSANAVEIDNVTETTEPEKKKEKKKKSAAREIFEWVYSIAIAIAVALAIKCFVVEIVKVDGRSMDPTLSDGQRLIVTRLGYKPHNGDIIILDSVYKKREEYFKRENITGINKIIKSFSLPNEYKKKYYVKRVIATEGQTVEITGGEVYVDNVKLVEPYIQGSTYTSEGDYKTTVEEGCVFVMGDNREHSSDSRDPRLGQVPIKSILGKAQLRVFPLSKFGKVK